MNKYLRSFILLSVCLLLSKEAFCGWPVRPKRLMVTPSVLFFTSNKSRDSTGHIRYRSDNGVFNTVNLSISAEYGISHRLSVNMMVPFIGYHQGDDKGNTFSGSGLGDLEAGLKIYVANINYRYYFTMQPTLVLPLYRNTNLGYAQAGGELKFGFSGSGKLGSKAFSISIENGIRQYFGNSGPFQDRYSANLGFILDKAFQNQLSLGVTGILSKSDISTFTQNIYAARDYAFTEVNLSYGHTFNSKFSLLGTLGEFVTGRNTSMGTVVSLSMIYRMDYAFAKKMHY